MNMFVYGVLVGVGVVSLAAIIILLSKIYTDLMLIKNSLNMMWIKIHKIEQMAQSTMSAAEGFVDALRQSAEDLMGGPPRMRNGAPDEFRDLKQTFEDGIRELEEDDSEDEEPDNWKK
jgi:hypothetical protein